MNKDELRSDFVAVRKMIKDERAMRLRVLKEPRRSMAVDECDAALVALHRLGQALALQFEREASQLALFEDGAPGTRLPEY